MMKTSSRKGRFSSRRRRGEPTTEKVTALEGHIAKPTLLPDGHTVRLPIRGAHSHKVYDVAHLAHGNDLWEPLGTAFIALASGAARPDGYTSAAKKLGQFFLYADGKYSSADRIDSGFFLELWAFFRALHGTTASKGKTYSMIRRAFTILCKKEVIQADLYIPQTPETGQFSTTGIRPKETVLSQSQLIQVGMRALEDCVSIMTNFENAREQIENQRRTNQIDKGYMASTPEEALEYIDRRFPGVIPDARELSDKHYRDYMTFGKLLGRMHDTRALFYPTPDKIVPFVIVLAIYTAFNADTVRFLRLSNITKREVDGVETITFVGEKPRASRPQTAVFPVTPDPDNPSVIVDFLKRWRQRVEYSADSDTRDRLFAFVTVPKTKATESGRQQKSLRSFGYLPSNVWANNLLRWRERHHLPPFTLGDIRSAILDMGDALTGGDLVAVQQLASHASSATTATHYSSIGGIKRAEERLGHLMGQRDRWHGTKGKIDPRNRPIVHDVAAATPGFMCLDPYDSPVAGETSGRLCRAYGACPACPLASIDTRSPYALQRALQLRERILEARERIDGPRWRAVWQTRLEKLEEWLPLFADTAIEQAKQDAQLGPIPPVE